ncbi:hypothetical protein CWI39_0027p0040 [Hamiltosporidium magnivora]|uniref:SLC41A/MgtE integral membrane domain-containing protein n=1 Tax=Hamiltosporidium magnivora TaxID=148818 RepID=A0A4Q9LNX2_9MICR|nr:hypothetical protein CWI39_0027p0040 [Hamiltosporidium magnivora]
MLIDNTTYGSSIYIQSLPSLFISLVGLALAGNCLDKALKTSSIQYYPILLISNCILNFKGNAELIYALHISSLSNSTSCSLKKYIRYSFDNSCLLLSQSIIIGLTVGLIGIAKNIFSYPLVFKNLIRILPICLVSCTLSTAFIVVLLIVAIGITKKCNINPDNVVLPTISSFEEYLAVYSLTFFTSRFNNLDLVSCYVIILIMIVILPLPIYLSIISTYRIPLQSFEILLTTYILSSISGIAVQFFSKKHNVLASTIPVFCGLTCSISYIYLSKTVTSLQYERPHNRKQSFVSLIVISLVSSIFYVTLSYFVLIRYSTAFMVLFVVFFVVDVCLLLRMVECAASRLNQRELGVFTLALLTSSSDFLGSILLIFIVEIIYVFETTYKSI